MLSNAPWQLALKQGPHEQKGSLAAFAVGLDAGNVIGAYSTGDKSSTSVCIVIPDILGWRSPQNLRLCDELADATGWLVVCPDLHRGNVVDKWVADQVSVPSIHNMNERNVWGCHARHCGFIMWIRRVSGGTSAFK